LVGACGGAQEAPSSAPAPTSSASARAGSDDTWTGAPKFVPGLRLLPDLSEVRAVAVSSDGADARAIVGRMRVVTRPGGAMDRADEVFPVGRVFAEELPPRLGGGFVFLVISGLGSQIFRAETWLGPLTPLMTIGQAPDPDRPLVMGFDRVYVRLRGSGDLFAFDPKTGAPRPYGPLPAAGAFGEMAFLDPFRAVVDTDVTGTFATFDAGATWAPVPLAQRLRRITAEPDSEDGGGALLLTDAGTLRLSAAGRLEVLPKPELAPGTVDGTSGPRRAEHPLRDALAHGYPDGPTSALAVLGGRVCRVSLRDGSKMICATTRAVAPHAVCHGVALGDARAGTGIGFVCDQDRRTQILAVGEDLALAEVLAFSTPRVVVESGQGAIVVHGSCSDEVVDDPAARPLCVRFVDGSVREIRLRGGVAAERVVAMDDGRVVIVVPPRPGAQGQLTILAGGPPKHVALTIPEGAPRELDTGLWLEGFHQSGAEEISGWVEGGGPLSGVSISLSGEVKAHASVEDKDGVVVGGRFGLKLGSSGAFLETTDTGKTWTEIVLPEAPTLSEQPATEVRCSAVGCLLPGAFKIGWGKTMQEDDLRVPDPPKTASLSSLSLSGAPRPLACRSLEGPERDKPPESKLLGTTQAGWPPLGPLPPPSLDKLDFGIDAGSSFDAVPVRIYVWGPKDTDWSRTGRAVLRFGDRFSLGEAHSSAVTTSPWSSEGETLMALGHVGGGMSWQASKDGQAVLASGCRGDRGCSLFAAEADQPLVLLRMADDTVAPRPASGAVRLGATWFYFAEARGDDLKLFRVDLGVVRPVATYRRVGPARNAPPPKLVRRARSQGLGLTFVERQGPNDRRGERFVVPIDPESGALGEPEALGRADLAGFSIDPCPADRDGWVLDTALDSQTVTIDGTPADGRSTELRLRLGRGRVCAETGVVTTVWHAQDRPRAKPQPAAGRATRTPPSGPELRLVWSSPLGVRPLLCDPDR
jgi:hypothetical protein